MSFWSMVSAVLVALVIWDIFGAVVKTLIKWIPEKKQERKIGFDGAESSGKTAKGVTMRKIGFGANDDI